MRYYIGLKQREEPLKINKWFIAGILFIMSIAYYLSTPAGCKLYASTVNDYCYKFTMNVNNGKSSAMSNYPVLLDNVDMSQWRSNNYIDDFAWSIFPYQASLTNEYQVLLQDINSVSSNQWYVFPSLSLGDNQLQVLIGADDIQRNQGIYFAGADYLNVANHNDFNQNNFRYEIEYMDAVPSFTGSGATYTYTILDKYDEATSQGLKLVYLDNGTTARFRATLDSTDLDTAYFTPTGSNEEIIFTYSGGTMELTHDGNPPVNVGATYTSNTEDLKIGAEDSSGTIQNYINDLIIRFIDYQTNSTLSAYYGFNPADMTQTSASDPDYAGSINDISYSANTHNANYYFSRSQQYITTTATNIVPSSSSGSTIFSSQTPDIVGRWFGSGNPGMLADENQNFFMGSFMNPPAGLLFPDQMWYSMYLSTFGIILAIGLFWIFNNIPVAMFGSSIPLVLGSINGYIAPEFMIIYGLLILSLYSTYSWYERS